MAALFFYRSLTSVFCSFAQVTLREVLGNQPPRAFVGLDEAARVRLYWDLKAQSTALRGQEHVAAQTPPVRFGPNRDQSAQPRPGRRARVLSAAERQARLAQEGQPAAQPPPAAFQPVAPPHAFQPHASFSQPDAPPASSQPATPPPVAQPAAPPASHLAQPFHMEWSPAPAAPAYSTASSQHVQSPASSLPVQSPLFPPRPQVFCIPASPAPLIPSRPLFFSLPANPPPFPKRTSLFSFCQPPPIPPRPFIFSVSPPGFHPRPYFMSGQCIQICPPVIPQRLFFMSGQCVSQSL